MYYIYLLLFSYPDSPEPLRMKRGFDKPSLHWPRKALTFANFNFFFAFCPMQQPLLQINLGKLAFLMKIYRRLSPQTVNQIFPGTIHLFLQCELVYSTSPKLLYLLWAHGYPSALPLDHQRSGRDVVENGF